MRATYLAATCLALGLGGAACETTEPYPNRPGGGGGPGGNEPPPDAAPADAAAGGGVLAGHVCVVVDLGNPLACPTTPQMSNVVVQAGDVQDISDSAGDFTLDLPTATATLRLGADPADTILTTEVRVTVTAEPVDVPAVLEASFDDALLTISEFLTTGAMLVYVRDGGVPVAGATVALDAAPQGARLYYDDGAGGFVPDAAATGADGAALVLDTTASTVTVTSGDRSASAQVPAPVGGVGVAIIELP